MTYTFEEIMDYHPDNKDVYSEIKENLSNLVPFVGAGLTQFAYFLWKDALTELAGKITITFKPGTGYCTFVFIRPSG